MICGRCGSGLTPRTCTQHLLVSVHMSGTAQWHRMWRGLTLPHKLHIAWRTSRFHGAAACCRRTAHAAWQSNHESLCAMQVFACGADAALPALGALAARHTRVRPRGWHRCVSRASSPSSAPGCSLCAFGWSTAAAPCWAAPLLSAGCHVAVHAGCSPQTWAACPILASISCTYVQAHGSMLPSADVTVPRPTH